MKNVIIVSKGNTAVAVGKDMQPITKTGVGTFGANLEVIKELLANIPVEAGETVHIYVPDLIQGIVSGSAVEYVKTGKTNSGNVLTAEEVAGFKDFYKLYAERILNVRFSQMRYIAKDNVELQSLKKKAWDYLNSNVVASAPVVTTQTVDPDKAIREAIDAQIVKALAEGNMEMFTMLKAERDKLKQPEVVQVQTVANSGTVQIHGVNFEEAINSFEDTAEDTMESNTVEENDMPLEFVDQDAGKEIAW